MGKMRTTLSDPNTGLLRFGESCRYKSSDDVFARSPATVERHFQSVDEISRAQVAAKKTKKKVCGYE